MRVRRLLLLVVLGAGPVRAHSVSNELALGLSEDSPESPHGTHIADQLTLRFDLDDDWTLKVGGAYTFDTAAPPSVNVAPSSAPMLEEALKSCTSVTGMGTGAVGTLTETVELNRWLARGEPETSR